MNKNTFTKKEFEDMFNNTPKELIGKDVFSLDERLRVKIGYYRKPEHNWSYTLYSIIYNKQIYNVATTFGKIKGRK